MDKSNRYSLITNYCPKGRDDGMGIPAALVPDNKEEAVVPVMFSANYKDGKEYVVDTRQRVFRYLGAENGGGLVQDETKDTCGRCWRIIAKGLFSEDSNAFDPLSGKSNCSDANKKYAEHKAKQQQE